MGTLPPRDTASNKVLHADMTVGAEASDVINVAIQLEWTSGAHIDRRCAVQFYLSDDPQGDDLAATAPSGGIAIGTDGLLVETVTDKAGLLVGGSDGSIDLDITEAGAATWYLTVVLPSGDLVVTDAITFAA